jgi:hypothetical protein
MGSTLGVSGTAGRASPTPRPPCSRCSPGTLRCCASLLSAGRATDSCLPRPAVCRAGADGGCRAAAPTRGCSYGRRRRSRPKSWPSSGLQDGAAAARQAAAAWRAGLVAAFRHRIPRRTHVPRPHAACEALRATALRVVLCFWCPDHVHAACHDTPKFCELAKYVSDHRIVALRTRFTIHEPALCQKGFYERIDIRVQSMTSVRRTQGTTTRIRYSFTGMHDAHPAGAARGTISI